MTNRSQEKQIDNYQRSFLTKLKSRQPDNYTIDQNFSEDTFTDSLIEFWTAIKKAQDYLNVSDVVDLLRIATGVASATEIHELKVKLHGDLEKHESREKTWKYLNVSILTVAVIFLVIALVFSAPGLLIVPTLGFAAGWGMQVARSYFPNETPKHERNILESLSLFAKSDSPKEYQEMFTTVTPK